MTNHKTKCFDSGPLLEIKSHLNNTQNSILNTKSK